jgi:hypothetical protein
MTSNECNICCDKYNQSVRKEIKCPFGDCGFSCCKTCVRTYLMGTTADPHCMNCKKSWNEQFLVTNLNRAFCEKEYKTHRKELLVEREMSKLPETMHLAERQKKVDIEEEKGKVISSQINELKKQLDKLKTQRWEISNTIHHIRNGTDKDGKTPERRKFIMSCSNNDCRGYLSTQYKCELCELFTCPECHEIIGHSKTDPHTCNPDSVASAEMIKKDTKPCPQCGVRIFKVSGCNQMWCTECKIAFNYVTLKIDTGAVHNPHYYQHLQQQNNGAAPRNPHDVLCGGLIGVRTLQQIFNSIKPIMDEDEYTILTSYVFDIHRSVSHITYNDLPRIRQAVRHLEDNGDLRIKYILGQTDKAQIGTLIYKRDNKRKKEMGLLHLYELLSVVGIENFNMIYQSRAPITPQTLIQTINEKIVVLDNLREYCNKEFAQISVTYNAKVMIINEMWQIGSHKYKISDLKT